jgi:DNA-binding XRE family transcriptional regulator
MQHSVLETQPKIKDTQLAKAFGVTTQTLRNWKKEEASEELHRRYQAFKEFYVQHILTK